MSTEAATQPNVADGLLAGKVIAIIDASAGDRRRGRGPVQSRGRGP